MENRSLVTIAEHSKEKILYMLNMAKEFEAKPNRHLLDGKVVATLFFEPSTRTRLSFETANSRPFPAIVYFNLNTYWNRRGPEPLYSIRAWSFSTSPNISGNLMTRMSPCGSANL
jgi:aspartate carbamoyltransferase catalytic subunit